MTIGITGATGHLGRLVVQDLISRGAATHAIALVRSPPKAADLGIPAREADYDRPETLRAAFQGVDTLLLISANEVGKRAVQHRNALDAAREAGVQRIIYTSLLHADTSVLDLAAEHLATEGMLKDLGSSWTILRNGWYTENYTGSLCA